MGTPGETSADHRFDGLFATVAEQAGGIEPLFDYFFGFLCRKTDFFTVSRDVCKEMLEKSFQKWIQKAKEKEERERIEREKKRQQQQQKQQKQQQQQTQPMDLENRPKVEELTEDEEALLSQAANGPATEIPDHQSEKGRSCEVGGKPPMAKPDDSDEETNTSRPEGNGGTTDKYRWTQTLEAVDVYVPVGSGVRASQCSVKITATKLCVGLKGQPPILGMGYT